MKKLRVEMTIGKQFKTIDKQTTKMKRIFLIVLTLTTKLTYASFPILPEAERSSWYEVGQIFGFILLVSAGSFILYHIYR